MKTDGKIHLHLLEFDSSSDANYIKDLGEVSFDAKGIAKVKFTTDGIKQEDVSGDILPCGQAANGYQTLSKIQ